MKKRNSNGSNGSLGRPGALTVIELTFSSIVFWFFRGVGRGTLKEMKQGSRRSRIIT